MPTNTPARGHRKARAKIVREFIDISSCVATLFAKPVGTTIPPRSVVRFGTQEDVRWRPHRGDQLQLAPAIAPGVGCPGRELINPQPTLKSARAVPPSPCAGTGRSAARLW